jgi:hypothetical protein
MPARITHTAQVHTASARDRQEAVTDSTRAKDARPTVAVRPALNDPIAPIREAEPERYVQPQPQATPQRVTATPRAVQAETSLPLAARSPVQQQATSFRNRDRSERDQTGRGVEVHIGTIEVRVAAPAPAPPQPIVTRRRDPISSTGRPAHAEPLSRGLAWSHGLVQG